MLQKPLIYVNRITNLSDARYCAGMGVDMLGFSIDSTHEDYVSPVLYQEMVGWIAGPKRVIEIPFSSPIDLDKAFDQYKPDLLHLSYSDINKYTLPDLPLIIEISFKDWTAHGDKLHLLGINIEHIMLMDLPKEVIKENILKGPYPMLLSLDKEMHKLTELLEKTGASGFAMQGSREQAPGLKDYDNLSTILEELDKMS